MSAALDVDLGVFTELTESLAVPCEGWRDEGCLDGECARWVVRVHCCHCKQTGPDVLLGDACLEELRLYLAELIRHRQLPCQVCGATFTATIEHALAVRAL